MQTTNTQNSKLVNKLENKLLIVDDDIAFSQVLQRSLEQHNFQVQICQNSQSAINNAQSWQPKHCLLDLKIGEESGLKLIPQLLETQPDLTIIMMTGFASISTVVEAMKLGASNYLAKPIDTAMVLEALNKTSPNPEMALDQDPMSIKRLEWEHIQSVLNKNNGNVSATARDLNMHRRTLQRKLAQKPFKR